MKTFASPDEQHDGVRSILEIIDIETSERTPIAQFEYLIEAPNWTSSGDSLVFNSRGRLFRLSLNAIEISGIDTGFATRCNNDHVLSPDGQSVAVSHHSVEDGQSRVYVVPFADGEPRLITPLGPSYLHGWSPDGQWLAYCAERGGEYDIYIIPTAGGDERRLTDAPGLSDGPEFSPDGKHIWFNSVRSGSMQVWRMEPDGSEQTQMTFEASHNWFPHVSPDGRHVVYLAYRHGDVESGAHPANKNVELRLMKSDGSDGRVLCRLFGGQGTINVNSWAPDSRRFAYVRYELV